MRKSLVAIAWVSLLSARPVLAAGPEGEPVTPPVPRATLDLGFLAGDGNSAGQHEPLVGIGLHLSIHLDRVVLSGGMDSGTMFLIGSGHAFYAAGAGLSWPVAGGRVIGTALYGAHFLKWDLFADEQHRLRVVGVRATAERMFGRGPFAGANLSASAFFDIERERDAYSGATVGGITILLAMGFALGM